MRQLTDDQLFAELSIEFENERRASHRILLYLAEVRSRHLYLERGYPSMFEMLIKHFHLSESSAFQRIKALELMTDVATVEEKLKSGEVNLSTLAMAQRQIRREEKLTGRKLSREKKASVVEAITGKTQKEAEKSLFDLLPESASEPRQSEKRVSTESTHVHWNLPNDVIEMIERLKEVWGNVDPGMDSVEVVRRSLKVALKRFDPKLKAEKKKRRTTESEVNRKSGVRPSYFSVL